MADLEDLIDRLFVLVVRAPGYRSRGPGSITYLSDFQSSSGSGTVPTQPREYSLEIWEYGHGNPLRCPRDTLYPQKLALTSPICGGRSVGIVRSRTTATEFFS
jgi:hypothetical protein